MNKNTYVQGFKPQNAGINTIDYHFVNSSQDKPIVDIDRSMIITHPKIRFNPIVQAAISLLLNISDMQRSNPENQSEFSYEFIVNNIKRFEREAQFLGCPHEDISTARYILCTAVDEAMTHSMNNDDSMQNQAVTTLLSTFHNETNGGEKIFEIIEQLTRNPVRYLDSMELVYFCLSLGFEGKYRFEDRGLTHLENLRDNLYRQIRVLRGNITPKLSINCKESRRHKNKMPTPAPIGIITLVIALSFAMLFGGFSYVLKLRSADVKDIYQLNSVSINQVPADRLFAK